jgi:predicted dienelactone hydrolase
LTGKVKRPLLTVHGTYDVLLPISQDSDVYAAMTPDRLHRYYRIEQGTHVDGLVDAYPDRLRPLAPCHRAAFVALERWLDGVAPPKSATLPRPADVATCPLS